MNVPELAPSLGRLIVPRRLAPPWVPLDDIREELATRVLELAGEGRRAAARQDLESVLRATAAGAWVAAWEGAVRHAAVRVAGALDQEIARATHRVRMPGRHARRRLLADGEKRALAARLASGGAPFLAAVEELGRAAHDVRAANAGRTVDPAVHGAWEEALRTAARRLEAAWLALEAEVEAERRRWEPEIGDALAWKAPLWPVLAAGLPLAALLLWLGLILGGYLPAPQWLADRLGF